MTAAHDDYFTAPATPTPGDLSARLQAWLLRHDLNDARSTETRALVSEAAAALSALPAGGGDEVPEDWTRFTFHDQRIACHPSIADRVQRALLREATTPQPSAAECPACKGVRYVMRVSGQATCWRCDGKGTIPADADVGAQGEGYDDGSGRVRDWRAPAAGKGVDAQLVADMLGELVYDDGYGEKSRSCYTVEAIKEQIAALTRQPEGKGVDGLPAKWRATSGAIAKPYGFVTEHVLGKAQALDACADELEAALTRQPVAGDGWRPIEIAPRDGTRVLLRLKHGLPAHVHGFEGVVFVGKWLGGHSHWAFAAPVGQAGFPDEWMDGWCRAAPADTPADGGEGK